MIHKVLKFLMIYCVTRKLKILVLSCFTFSMCFIALTFARSLGVKAVGDGGLLKTRPLAPVFNQQRYMLKQLFQDM